MVLFQLHRNRGVKSGYHLWSWSESQIQVNHTLNTIISYLQSSNVLRCPTLVLLSQTRFLLLLSGSYGYDRNYRFKAKMIINIRNEGNLQRKASLVKVYEILRTWMIECTKWHVNYKVKHQFKLTGAWLLSIY